MFSERIWCSGEGAKPWQRQALSGRCRAITPLLAEQPQTSLPCQHGPSAPLPWEYQRVPRCIAGWGHGVSQQRIRTQALAFLPSRSFLRAPGPGAKAARGESTHSVLAASRGRAAQPVCWGTVHWALLPAWRGQGASEGASAAGRRGGRRQLRRKGTETGTSGAAKGRFQWHTTDLRTRGHAGLPQHGEREEPATTEPRGRSFLEMTATQTRW